MRKITQRTILLAAFCFIVSPQHAAAQGVWTTTSINFDSSSNTVYAYASTELDYGTAYFYSAVVSSCLVNTAGQQDCKADSEYLIAEVFMQLPAQPSTVYTAVSAHYVFVDYYFYPSYYYYDYWSYSYYSYLGIYEPYWYDFYSPGYYFGPLFSPIIMLGETYDSTSLLTPGLQVNISGEQAIHDGETATFSVSTSGGTPTSYQWSYRAPSGAGNNPHVTFSAPTSATTHTDGHWFAYPNQECSAGAESTYTIKCEVTFAGGKKKSAETKLKVNAAWLHPGATTTATITGNVAIFFNSTTNRYQVQPGSLSRTTATFVNGLPAASQFHPKVVAHEQNHVDQWMVPGRRMYDIYRVESLLTQLLPLTDTTQGGLAAKIVATFNAWNQLQIQTYASRRYAGEIEAYAVSDSIVPRYLYQRCGRTEFPEDQMYYRRLGNWSDYVANSTIDNWHFDGVFSRSLLFSDSGSAAYTRSGSW